MPTADLPNRPTVHRRLALLALVAVGLGVAIWLLADAGLALAAQADEVDWRFVAIGWIIATLSAWLSFLSFDVLLRRTAPGISRRGAAHLYFAGQLMKHLPGRVWGIAYQGVRLQRQVGLGVWVSINLMFLGVSTVVALAASAAVLVAPASILWSAAIIALATAGIVLAWRDSMAQRLLSSLRWLPARLLDALHQSAPIALAAQRRDVLSSCALLWGSWVAYLGAWALYGAAYPSLGLAGGLSLAALYTIAWLAGYVAFVTPSGLGIREAVFAALAVSYPGDAVLYCALLGRAALLATDVVLGLLFLHPQHDDVS